MLKEGGTRLSSFLTSTQRRLLRNSVLFHDGDPQTSIYEITEGTIKTSKILMDGRRQIIGFLGAGDLVGEPFEEEAQYCAEAVTDVTVLCYPILQLEAAITRSPALARQMMQVVHQASAHQMDHIISLGRKHPAERVASFLVTWHANMSKNSCESRTLSLPMSRIDIADYLGLTQETVCRVLSKFKRQGIIQAKPGREVTIYDLRSLEYMAETVFVN